MRARKIPWRAAKHPLLSTRHPARSELLQERGRRARVLRQALQQGVKGRRHPVRRHQGNRGQHRQTCQGVRSETDVSARGGVLGAVLCRCE